MNKQLKFAVTIIIVVAIGFVLTLLSNQIEDAPAPHNTLGQEVSVCASHELKADPQTTCSGVPKINYGWPLHYRTLYPAFDGAYDAPDVYKVIPVNFLADWLFWSAVVAVPTYWVVKTKKKRAHHRH